MQPIYITLSSTGASPWKLANWQTTPQQFGFAVISTGGSSWSIDMALEDPTGVYPNPNLVGGISSQVTAFTLLQGSANQVIGMPSSLNIPAIAAYRLTLNTQSSAGAKVTLVTVQSGIG